MELRSTLPSGVYVQVAWKNELGISEEEALSSAIKELRTIEIHHRYFSAEENKNSTYNSNELSRGEFLESMKAPKVNPVYNLSDFISLATSQGRQCGKTELTTELLLAAVEKEEKENTMCYECGNTPETMDIRQLEYFLGRSTEIQCEKDEALQKKFGLIGDNSPASAQELVDRIASGKFVLDPEKKDKKTWTGDLLSRFSWRDPAIIKDEVAYETAKKKLWDAFTLTRDAIMSAPAKGAEAVAAFAATA